MTKKVIYGAVLAALCCQGASRAQSVASETVAASQATGGPPVLQRPETGLSSWITYDRNNCCFGNVGGDAPIATELFMRIGPSVPIGGEFLGHVLQNGWMVQGGGRALFFNRCMEAAWFVEVSLSNAHNHSGLRLPILLPREPIPISVQAYNRTCVNLGLGREWYLYPATDTGRNWRIGIDTGGRYGSASLGFYDSGHETDVIGGVYGALHSDLEFPFCPCGSPCIFQAGFRIEYGYTWSDILRKRSDLQDLNFLFNFGVRY